MTAVAVPLIFSSKCLKGAITSKAITPSKYSLSWLFRDVFLTFVNLSFLGKSAVEDIGKIFRQTPGNTTKMAGVTGINKFQNNIVPISSLNSSRATSVTPISHNNTYVIFQILAEMRRYLFFY